MPVIRNLTHVTIDLERLIAKSNPPCQLQLLQHVLHVGLVWLSAMEYPYDHGHRTYLAIGDPTDVILVVPMRELRRLTQIAVLLRSAWADVRRT